MLHIKYRPKNLRQLVGNKRTKQALEMLLSSKNKPHTYLFTGPAGCGKTTTARIIAGMLGAKENDIIEMNTADFRGIDTVRALNKNAGFTPLYGGQARVWVIDECHKLTNDAQNAFLKLLEEPPNHVYFILCTTDPQKLLKTIRSRCSVFKLLPLTERETIKLLMRICKKEKKKVSTKILEQIHDASEGRPRKALQILNQVFSINDEEEQEKIIKQSVAGTEEQIIDLCRALIKGASWKQIAKILKAIEKEEPETIRRIVLSYCKSVLLNSQNDTAAEIMEQFIDPFYDSGFPGVVFACYCIGK